LWLYLPNNGSAHDFGIVQDHSFNNIVVEMNGNEPVFLGQEKSVEIFNYLTLKGT